MPGNDIYYTTECSVERSVENFNVLQKWSNFTQRDLKQLKSDPYMRSIEALLKVL